MLQPGHIINETYRVEKLLGSGGMADVYVVAHMRLPRRFALKVMRLEAQVREAFLARFSREGEILATIRHPHIVDVIDRNQLPDGHPYLVMELLEGEDLSIYLARTGALSIPVALRICSQIGDALEAAHKVGIVHRDLKPSNIFLSKQGQVLNFVKVLDFGIAKMARTERTPMTAPFALMGTPAYMSPEQARGQQSKIDARTDQFALGAVLYEMLTGRGAFFEPGDLMYAILERVLLHHPAPLKDPQVNRAVMRALAKEPEQRFPSLKEFLAAVGATTHTVYSLPSLAKETPGTLSSQISERSVSSGRGRTLTKMGVGMGLAAGAMGLFFTLRSSRPNLPLAHSAGTVAAAQASSGAPPYKLPATALSDENTRSATAPEPVFIQIPGVPSSDPEAKPGLPSAEQKDAPAQNAPASVGLTAATPSRPEADAKPTSPRPLTPARPMFTAGRRFVVFGVKNAALEARIRQCAEGHLLPLRLPEGSAIKLERSGTLTVVDAPPAVFGTSINACFRQTLSNIEFRLLPQSVVLKVVK